MGKIVYNSRLLGYMFKSFHETMVDFGTLTVLVGTNASGKSNLKDALKFLYGVRGRSRLPVFRDFGWEIRSLIGLGMARYSGWEQ